MELGDSPFSSFLRLSSRRLVEGKIARQEREGARREKTRNSGDNRKEVKVGRAQGRGCGEDSETQKSSADDDHKHDQQTAILQPCPWCLNLRRPSAHVIST